MHVHIDIETRSAADLRKVGQYVYAEHPTTEIITVCYAIDSGPVQTWFPPTSTHNEASVEALAAKMRAIGTGPTIHEANPSPGGQVFGGEMPDDLYAAILSADRFLAHNAGFERTVLTGPSGLRIGFPACLKAVELWDCTAARAACMGLPRSLEGASGALGLPVQKDKEGHALMLRMCKPRKPRQDELYTPEQKAFAKVAKAAAVPESQWPEAMRPDRTRLFWYDDDERMIRLAQYCAVDVEVERGIDKRLPQLIAPERAMWAVTERMNDRGVLVDRALLAAAARMIDQAEADLNRDISERTGGAVPAVTDSGAISRWLTAQGIEDHIDPTTRKASVAKAVVAAILDDPETDPLVREVLILRRDGGGSSSKKWRAIEQRLSADGRAKGALVYCGASSTGRFSSRGIQLQNLPRGGTIKGLMSAIDDLCGGAEAAMIGMLYGPPLIVASEMLRPAFISAPGRVLARGDYSQIEARVNPWLAAAEWKLDAFRAYDTFTGEYATDKKGKVVALRAGPDLYKIAAAGIFRCSPDEIDDGRRQTGKVSELALGFGGGAGALQNMAKAYKMAIPRHPKDPRGLPMKLPGGPAIGTDEWIKRQWRASNPEIAGLWAGLEESALECMRLPPGAVVHVPTLKTLWDEDGGRTYEPMHKTPLSWCRNSAVLTLALPSGRRLFYWTPRVRKIETPFGEKWTLFYRAEDSVTHQWKEWAAWGGLLCENAVQAVARDIMRDCLLRLYSKDILPVLTVHDEGIVEIASTDAKAAAALIEAEMNQPCAWAPGLPIAADSSAGPRYLKD